MQMPPFCDENGMREIARLRSENARLDAANGEAVAALMSIASLTQTDRLLWWQKKAREALAAMGVNI